MFLVKLKDWYQCDYSNGSNCIIFNPNIYITINQYVCYSVIYPKIKLII